MNGIRLRLVDRVLIGAFWLFVLIGMLYAPRLHYYVLGEPRSINVLTWPDLFDRDLVDRFERETGITVNFTYFESNDEILTKLELTGGEGYDMITATDYAVDELRKRNLLQQIDSNKFSFWNTIEPQLLGHYFDPENKYSIPYIWDVYGIGFNRSCFNNKTPVNSWALIFDPAIAQNHIAMIDDGTELVHIAWQYLFGKQAMVDDDRLEAIKKLFIQQLPLVELYSDMRGDHLLASGTSPLAITQSAYIKQAMNQNSFIDFLIPQEGSFVVIDAIVIPSKTAKQDQVYAFIEYLFREEMLNHIYEKYSLLSCVRSHMEQLDLQYLGGLEYILNPERFKQFQFFKREIAPAKINDLWIDIKSY